MIKYISKPSKSLERLKTTLDRGRETIEQIEDRTLVKNVEYIDGNKPFTTININLNTNSAFPDMPDLIDDSYSTKVIQTSFEKGAPHRDANLELLLARLKDQILKQIKDVLENKESVKIQLGGLLQLYKLRQKDNELEYVQSNQHTATKARVITRATLDDSVNELINNLVLELLSEKQQDSGWKVRRIPAIFIQVYQTRPSRGASYIPTPLKYRYPKNCLINIQNDDQMCFAWCMKYHQSKKGKHDDRITVLKKVEDKFIYDGINYPTTFDDITRFEDLNEVSIFVYGIGKN
jgi:hypothetical protein